MKQTKHVLTRNHCDPLDKSFSITRRYEMSVWDVSQIFQKVMMFFFPLAMRDVSSKHSPIS